jgi:hypothetical protein
MTTSAEWQRAEKQAAADSLARALHDLDIATAERAVVDVVMGAYTCGLYRLPEGVDAACAALAKLRSER